MKKIKQYKGYELRSEEAKFPDGKSKGWFVNWIVSPQGSNAYMDNKETEGIENFEKIVDVCIEHGDENGNYPRARLLTGNELKQKLVSLGHQVDNTDWDNDEPTDCVERWEE